MEKVTPSTAALNTIFRKVLCRASLAWTNQHKKAIRERRASLYQISDRGFAVLGKVDGDLVILAAAGRMLAMPGAVKLAENLARAEECGRIVATVTRPALAKFLARHGFRSIKTGGEWHMWKKVV